ncbi:putative FAD-dependent dehydrogenase [Kribbella sandramycini]|uniref:Putative FAD-dependent dehydrogenase n=1 Tax=Kribbella sandramycini TaxID=60450 RepID=A0A841S9I0_9ACTN|nr:putative FAD-dependent dehydrogenase [Kribbella sandramycini]
MNRLALLVVGAGPAGIFAALRSGLPPEQVLIVDEGREVEARLGARRFGLDVPGTIATGFGGAGLFSNGQLCLTHQIGSTIAHRFPAAEVNRRQHAIDAILHDGMDIGELRPIGPAAGIAATARRHGLSYLQYAVRQLDSDQLIRMTTRLRDRILHTARLSCETACVAIEPTGGGWLVRLEGKLNGVFEAANVVLAPGKAGAGWLRETGTALGLSREAAAPRLGVRLQGPAGFLSALLAGSGDPRLTWSVGDGVRVRLQNLSDGDVVPATSQGLIVVGGTSARAAGFERSSGTVMVTSGLCAADVRRIVAGVNDASRDGVLTQSLPEFLAGGGGLDEHYPARLTELLRRFVLRLANVCPEVLHPSTVVHGPAVEGLTDRFDVTDELEARGRPGLYLAGDGPGLTGGIIGAADSGWLAGASIARRSGRTAARPRTRRPVPGVRTGPAAAPARDAGRPSDGVTVVPPAG